MITEIFYSVANGGDGSAYPFWFETLELAELDQEFMSEGWGESCTGSIRIEHEGPIRILDTVETAETIRKSLLENLSWYERYGTTWNSNANEVRKHLFRIEEIIERKNAKVL